MSPLRQQGSEQHVQYVLRLLPACTGLEELDLQAEISFEQMQELSDVMERRVEAAAAVAGGAGSGMQPAAVHAASSTSPSAAAGGAGVGAVLATCPSSQPRLRVLRLRLMPDEQLLSFVQQQLGPRLETLALLGGVSMADLGSGLSQCSRLRNLDLQHPYGSDLSGRYAAQLPAGLGAFTALTALGLRHFGLQQVPEALGALTALRSLDLSHNELSDLEGVPGLQHLTVLDVRKNRLLRTLPADLGEQLPALQELRLDNPVMQQQVPSNLSALSRLEAFQGTESSGELHEDAFEGLASLQHLQLGLCMTVESLGRALEPCDGLQVLVLQSCFVDGMYGAFQELAALPHLRHLDVGGVKDYSGIINRHPLTGEIMVQGRLVPPRAHLTHLDLSGSSQWLPIKQLPLLGVLPCLQQLLLVDCDLRDLEQLGPWLVQQQALTHLDLSSNPFRSEDHVQPLPAQLEVLALRGRYARCSFTYSCRSISLHRLPPNLAQLTRLSELHLGANQALWQLPGWLSCLRHLELLGLWGTGISTQQDVLAALPSLRRVWLSPEKSAAVFAGAKHLHFAEPQEVAW